MFINKKSSNRAENLQLIRATPTLNVDVAKLPTFVPQEIEVGTELRHSATPIDYKTFRVVSFLQVFHNINHHSEAELCTFPVDFIAAPGRAQFICLEL